MSLVLYVIIGIWSVIGMVEWGIALSPYKKLRWTKGQYVLAAIINGPIIWVWVSVGPTYIFIGRCIQTICNNVWVWAGKWR